jgi:aspartyl protease
LITRSLLAAALMLWFAYSAGAPVRAAEKRAPFAVPLTVTAYGLAYVPIEVGGARALALVDTGSFMPLEISHRLARRLRVTLRPTDQIAAGYDFEKTRVFEGSVALRIGAFRERSTTAAVVGDTLEQTERLVGTPFDAVIGWGFLRKYYTLIDYRLQRFQFDARPFTGRGYRIAVRFRDENDAPLIDGSVDGKPTTLLLDTGAPHCTLDSVTFALPPRALVERSLTIGDSTQRLQVFARDMSVNRPLGVDGIVGTNLLDRYAVAIDPHDGLVELF